MNMNMEFKVIKYRHIDDKWFALYEMVKDEIWCIIIYDEDEETQLFSCIYWDYTTALHKYNEIKDGKIFLDLY